MKKVTPYLANGCPKTCWNWGKPFGVRDGRTEAIVGHNDRLYCHEIECKQVALVPLVHALRPARIFKQAA